MRHLRWTHHGETAQACRERLGASLPAEFFASVRDGRLAPTLIARPTKNLYVQDGSLPQFGDQAPPLTTTRQLLNAVWQVRNNLFHGNKMHPADRARDAALMQNALAVIEAIMQWKDDLSSAFHDPQQFF